MNATFARNRMAIYKISASGLIRIGRKLKGGFEMRMSKLDRQARRVDKSILRMLESARKRREEDRRDRRREAEFRKFHSVGRHIEYMRVDFGPDDARMKAMTGGYWKDG
jgi:hypothetical protein